MGDLSWHFYVQQFIAGISLAMFLFLIASGLSLILGVMGIVNFAHGSFYMMGSYLVWYFAISIGMGFWLAVIAASATLALIGYLLQKFLISRLYGRPELQLLFTFAIVLIFSDLIKMAFGVLPKSIGFPNLFSDVLEVGAISFPTYYIFIIVLGPIVAYLLHLAEQRTRIGRVIRAASLNRDMVATLGINTERVFTIIFGFGSFLAGLGGALASPIASIAPGMDIPIVLPAFVAVVVGGLGSFGGTFFACLLIGQVKVFGILLFPRLAESFIFILMLIILIVRPWGLSNKPPKV